MGEKLDAFEPFYPERMAKRILGMGDVISLIEKAQEVADTEMTAGDGGASTQGGFHPRRLSRAARADQEDGRNRPAY